MKIGYMLPYFYPVKDGTENNCRYLAREMVKLGHEVHVFTSDRKDGEIFEPKEEILEGIHLHRNKTWFRYKHHIAFHPAMLKKILKTDLDILHVHGFCFPEYDLIMLLKKLLSPKTKIVNTTHGPFPSLNKYPLLELITAYPFRWLEKPINKITTDSAIQVNTLQHPWIHKIHGIPKSKIDFVPDGIPEDRFREVDPTDFAEKWGLKDKWIICNLGRVQKYKGLDHVIKVLPNLVKKHPNIMFLSMGKDHGDKERLLKMAKDLGVEDHVVFTGMVSEEDKLKGLDLADVFTLPSEWEAFGIVTLEAYARKTPSICTKHEGARFLDSAGFQGFLFDFGDTETFEKQILTLIEDKKLHKEMCEKNYELSKRFTNEYIAKNDLQNLYYKLTKLPRNT